MKKKEILYIRLLMGLGILLFSIPIFLIVHFLNQTQEGTVISNAEDPSIIDNEDIENNNMFQKDETKNYYVTQQILLGYTIPSYSSRISIRY